MEFFILIIMVVIAVLAGPNSKENTRRKRDRMINDIYDRKYRN